MNDTTSLRDEMERDRERRTAQAPPETGAWYTADFTEDDDGPSWARVGRLHDNPYQR